MMKQFRKMLLRLLHPTIVIMGNMRMPFSRKRMDSSQYRSIRSILHSGMILLTRTEGELSTMIIPGKWKHVGIFDGKHSVVEATKKGVIKTDLIDFIMRTDYIAVCIPTFADEIERHAASKWAEEQEGKPYDYFFENGGKSFYCSELVVNAYINTMGKDNVPFKMRKRIGEPTVTPDDIANAIEKWKMIYNSSK